VNSLELEAISITQDLGPVIFIGAVATWFHTKAGRKSRDLDFVVATKLSDEFLESKGYLHYPDLKDNQRITPRHMKVDIYNDRAIKEVSLETIVETAVNIPVSKNQTVKVVNLNVFIVLKFRAGRGNDLYDLRLIAERKFKDIDWIFVQKLSNSDVEFETIKKTMYLYHEGY
jgi:hypothetical protein